MTEVPGSKDHTVVIKSTASSLPNIEVHLDTDIQSVTGTDFLVALGQATAKMILATAFACDKQYEDIQFFPVDHETNSVLLLPVLKSSVLQTLKNDIEVVWKGNPRPAEGVQTDATESCNVPCSSHAVEPISQEDGKKLAEQICQMFSPRYCVEIADSFHSGEDLMPMRSVERKLSSKESLMIDVCSAKVRRETDRLASFTGSNKFSRTLYDYCIQYRTTLRNDNENKSLNARKWYREYGRWLVACIDTVTKTNSPTAPGVIGMIDKEMEKYCPTWISGHDFPELRPIAEENRGIEQWKRFRDHRFDKNTQQIVHNNEYIKSLEIERMEKIERLKNDLDIAEMRADSYKKELEKIKQKKGRHRAAGQPLQPIHSVPSTNNNLHKTRHQQNKRTRVKNMAPPEEPTKVKALPSRSGRQRQLTAKMAQSYLHKQ
jgi:hypothetical protein